MSKIISIFAVMVFSYIALAEPKDSSISSSTKVSAVTVAVNSPSTSSSSQEPLNSSPSKSSSNVTSLDRSLNPLDLESDEISSVFQNMIVVQRKAKVKAKKMIVNPHLSLDFSDGPKSIYGFHLNTGYAFSDYFEAYIKYVPFYFGKDRPIVTRVSDLVLENGKKASLVMADPISAIGVDLIWALAYGKHAWGAYTIVRSDIFFKAGASTIKYTDGPGACYSLMMGTTLFFSEYFNLRFSAGLASIETFVNQTKASSIMGLFEPGLVWYF